MQFKLFAATAAVLALTSGAMANCYEEIGCSDSDTWRKTDLRQFSCQVLWELRNTIYFENGYCFKTDRAVDFFGNDECFVTNQSKVRLNNFERANVAAVAAVEKQKGCS